MTDEQRPHQLIASMVAARAPRTDLELLAELQAVPPLRDEPDRHWDDPAYWSTVVYPFLALSDLIAARHLRAAVPLLLDRACFGDPGEIMRGLPPTLEAAVDADWPLLADFCLAASQSPRPGTRLWAIDELIVLDDPRAREVFEQAAKDPHREIRCLGEIGLERLNGGAA